MVPNTDPNFQIWVVFDQKGIWGRKFVIPNFINHWVTFKLTSSRIRMLICLVYSRLLYELKYNWLFHCHPHTLWATFWLFHNLLEHGNCLHIWNWNKNKTMYWYFHYRSRKIYQNCPWMEIDKVRKQSIVKFNWNRSDV